MPPLAIEIYMSFDFKKFSVNDANCAMKIGTDGVLLGAWADVAGARSVLDIGAGSGLVALMVAQRNAEAAIVAVEVDAGAAADCAGNIAASPWSERIVVHTGDFANYAPTQPIDLIVSNPPFFTEALRSPSALRAQARHEAGLSPKTLIAYASRVLAADGSLAMITPCTDADNILYTAEMAHLKLRCCTEVAMRHGDEPTRMLWQFCRKDGHVAKTTLTLRASAHEWTDEYLQLTSAFYIKTPKI
jgi:tRNA1Val (adenine37-N6)-methyltransferase